MITPLRYLDDNMEDNNNDASVVDGVDLGVWPHGCEYRHWQSEVVGI